MVRAIIAVSGILVVVGCGRSDQLQSTKTRPLTIARDQLPEARFQEPYAASLEVFEPEFHPAVTWQLMSGVLPPGLELTTTLGPVLRFAGAPTTLGRFNFTFRVTSPDGEVDTADFTLEVAPATRLRIVTDTLPPGRVGEGYFERFFAVGTEGLDVEWSVLSALPTGLLLGERDGASAVLSGRPVVQGEFTFGIQVEADGAVSDQRQFVLRIDEPLRLRIAVEDPPPVGMVGLLYRLPLEALGGEAPYTWSILSGSLPEDLRLFDMNQTAEIRGVPMTPGTNSFLVGLRDGRGTEVQARIILEVRRPSEFRIVTETLPSAVFGRPYENLVLTEGSIAPIQWEIRSRDDIDWLRPQGQGDELRLSGTPPREGTFILTIEAQDGGGRTDMRTYTLEVVSASDRLRILTSRLPVGGVGVPYSATIEATGGTGPYRWIEVQNLPPGFALTGSGLQATLTGTPPRPAMFSVLVRVTDSTGADAQRNLPFRVVAPGPPPTVLPRLLPDGEACTGYAETISAIGGTGDLEWSVVQGGLPPGLDLESSGRTTVLLHGFPTTSGPFDFTLQVEDELGRVATLDFSLLISAVPSGRWIAAQVVDASTTEEHLWLSDTCSYPPANPVRVTPVRAGPGRPSLVSYAFAPDGSALAFIGDYTQDEVYELYLVEIGPNGPGTAQVVSTTVLTGGDVDSFQWSPDARWLTYQGDLTTDGQRLLYRADIAGRPGSGFTQVDVTTGLPMAFQVSEDAVFWAPDSSGYVFHGDLRTDDGFELYWAAATAQTYQPVRSMQSGITQARVLWSPLSDGFVFRSNHEVSTRQDLFWVTLTNGTLGTPIRITQPMHNGADVDLTRAAMAPDGSALFFISDQTTPAVDELHVVLGLGTSVGRPVRAHRALIFDRDIRNATWSPDSTRILFNGDIDVDEQRELFVVDALGPYVAEKVNAPLGPIGADVSPLTYGWSPDAAWVAYLVDDPNINPNEIFLVDMSQPTMGAPVRVGPVRVDAGLDVVRYSFSSDASRIAVVGDLTVNGRFELYTRTLSPGVGVGSLFTVNARLGFRGDVALTPDQIFWKPDGSAVFYMADLDVDMVQEGWMSPLVGPLERSGRLLAPLSNTERVNRLAPQP